MAATPFGSGKLDKLLDIIFTKQCTYIANRDAAEWDMIKKVKASDPIARSTRFRLIEGLGFAAAAAGRDTGAQYNYPRARLSDVREYEANYKTKTTTVGITWDLWNQAKLAKDKKALEPLLVETESKATANTRIISAEFWTDGTGVRGTVLSVNQAAIATGSITVTLEDLDATRGHANLFEYTDVLVAKTVTGTAQTTPSGAGAASLYGYQVTAVDYVNQTVTFDLVDENLVVITNITNTNLAATNVFYRVDGQQSFPDLTNNASIGDYGLATQIMPGMETLAADDGRTVFGMTMSGIRAGTQVDAGGDPFDALMIDEVLAVGANRVGASRFKYAQMVMDDFTHRQLIDSRETDRYFTSAEDNTRGTSYFAYKWRDQKVRAVISQYVRRRVWLLPELTSKEKVLEYHGTDWQPVDIDGVTAFLQPGSVVGTQSNQRNSYKTQKGILINRVPAAVCCIRNYSLSV